jgi:large subunit ribosomal protein L25
VDLFAVRMTEELAVDVPLVAVGQSPLVELHGGTLIHPTEHIRVRALPEHLPQLIEYSVEALAEFDQAIHVGDLAVPAGVTLLTDPDEIVAKVLRARIEEEVAPAVEAPAEEEAPAAEAAETTAEGSGGEEQGR